MNNKKPISILTNIEETDTNHGFQLGAKKVLAEVQVEAEVLEKNINEFLDSMSTVFGNIKTQLNKYELEEIELNLGISAKGGIHLIGTIDIEASTSITLKFKKKL